MELLLNSLFYAVQVLPLVLAFVAALALPLFIAKLYERMALGVILMLFAFVLSAIWMGDRSISLGVRVYLTDVVSGFIGIATVFRYLLDSFVSKMPRAWLAFCLVVMLSIMSGLLLYGTAAGVQARPYFYFIVSASYVMSFPASEERLRGLVKWLSLAAIVLVALAIYRWIVFYVPIYALLPPGGVYNIDGPMRVIYSNETLLLAMVFVLTLFFPTTCRFLGWGRVLLPVLGGCVLVLQHRSVWLATIVGVLIALKAAQSQSSQAWRKLVWMGLVALFVALPLMLSSKFSGVSQSVARSATSAISGAGTVQARIDGWGGVLKNWSSGGVKSILFGRPFGTENIRYQFDSNRQIRKVDYQAHNMYVQTLFNLGLVGLLSFVFLVVWLVAGLYRLWRSGASGVYGEALLVLVAMQLVYFVAYGVSYVHAFVLGAAVAYLCRRPEIREG